MPIDRIHLEATIVKAVWKAPLRSEELTDCFGNMASFLDETDETVNIIFDIREAGMIPAQAPFLFIRAEIVKKPNLGRIAVVGKNPVAEVLAHMATRMTQHTIEFFVDEAGALNYLQQDM